MSGFLKLNFTDLAKGVSVAVIGAVVTALYQLVQSCTTFSCFSSFNWAALGQNALLVGISYILKNLLSTSDGKFLGAIG